MNKFKIIDNLKFRRVIKKTETVATLYKDTKSDS